MFQEKKIGVVIPAHNEERLIFQTIENIPSFVDRIIVVDDASTDGTANIVRRFLTHDRVELIQHPVNRGVGGAIITGYARAMEAGLDLVAIMAGDAQMDPRDLPRLLTPLVNGVADYSKGDRLSWSGVFRIMPMMRFVGNHVLSVLTRLTSGYRDVRDSQCGYTAISTSMLARIPLDDIYARYGFPNDILAHLHSAGARLAQVRVRPIYGEEISGISLATGLFKVPFVLLRSYWHRRRRSLAKRRALLPQIRRA